MMYGRVAELDYLNTYYDRTGSQILVVYGEKNVGKTTLLSAFSKDKPGIYLRARSASEREQRFLWNRELGSLCNDSYPSFTEIFQAVLPDEKGKKVIIIDEFQYIVKVSDSFMKELIGFVHEKQDTSEIMVILCSSSIGWVENSMITRIREAAYELSGLLKIKELDFEVMTKYFTNFNFEKNMEAYAILGGNPGLWKHFDDKQTIKNNICNQILNSEKFLYFEGQRIVEKQLRETNVYNTILAAIAAGNQKLNDLYRHTEFSRAKISVYLKNLMELELVEKVYSCDTEGKVNAQKGIYRISNQFVHFYFTFLYPNLSSLEVMGSDAFYESFIKPYFKAYVERYYKKVCAQKMENWNREGKLPFAAERFDEWVGKFGNIDIIAQGEKGETIIGLCNYEKPMMQYDDYEWLLFCAEKAKVKADYIYLFSAGRFEEKLCLEAKVKQNLRLIGVDEM